jgi:hypothetical protein
MKRIGAKMAVIQNMGWLDRVVRVILGSVLLAFAISALGPGTTPPWALYVALVSVYPLLTGIIGWDPIYEAVTVKTCGTSERNPCGTFPFEVDAALGHHPIPRNDVEHSLENSKHSP